MYHRFRRIFEDVSSILVYPKVQDATLLLDLLILSFSLLISLSCFSCSVLIRYFEQCSKTVLFYPIIFSPIILG